MAITIIGKGLVPQSCLTLCDPTDYNPPPQPPLSMGFTRQEYWSGLPFPPPGVFLTQGSNLGLPPCRQIPYRLSHQGSPLRLQSFYKETEAHRSDITCPRSCTVSLAGRFSLLSLCTSALSRVWLFVTPWTVAHQAPLSMGSSRQEYWSGLPCPPPGDLPDPGIEPPSLKSPALAGGFFTTSVTWEASPFLGRNYLLPRLL